MKERGILFSAPMVRAILAGTKTQTRRVVKPQPTTPVAFPHHINWRGGLFDLRVYRTNSTMYRHCPYGQPGDRLWVRETWSKAHDAVDWHQRGTLLYRADVKDERDTAGVKWKPAIHMPRTFSRITLEITAVRVERLQDISEADAIADGVNHYLAFTEGFVTDARDKRPMPVKWYEKLWESINGPGSWDANPWVWVIEFRRAR